MGDNFCVKAATVMALTLNLRNKNPVVALHEYCKKRLINNPKFTVSNYIQVVSKLLFVCWHTGCYDSVTFCARLTLKSGQFRP